MAYKKSKQLFGIICFGLSIALFSLVWLLSKQKASLRKKEIAIYNTHTDHLSEERKCSCAYLLLKMEKKIFLNLDIESDHNLFNQYCFNFPSFKQINIEKLIHSFNLKTFSKNQFQNIFHSILFKIAGNNEHTISHSIKETKQALENNKLEHAYIAFSQIPHYSLSNEAKAWKKDLEYLLSQRSLIRLAVCKLLTPQESKGH